MSACQSLALHYTSPSLPAAVQLAKTEDGQLIQSLLAKRETQVDLMKHAGKILLDNPELASLMGYCANYTNESRPVTSIEEAINRLEKNLWSTLLSDARFTMLMPTARRAAFLASLNAEERPPFTAEHVIPTVQGWLLDQDRYFAERVDEIFHALSDTHITNSPAGFGGKMILKISETQSGRVLDELRLVLACLLGHATRLEAATMSYGSGAMLDALESKKQFNQSITLDSGALALKIYKVGTCHITIDPELAAHLNDILSMIYPLSIPAKFRAQNPIKAAKFVASAEDMLPVRTMATLMHCLKNNLFGVERRSETFPFIEKATEKLPRRHLYYTMSLPDNQVIDDNWKAIALALGAVIDVCGVDNELRLVFDYNAKEIIPVLSRLGGLPNIKEHQFYPSKGQIARDFSQRVLAHHTDEADYLEPSTGHADLLGTMEFISRTRLTTLELAPLFCEILRLKGYATIQGDFLSQAREWFKTQRRFHRVVMNPPFCNQQAKNHVLAAYHLLHAGGKVFAILPASLYNAFDDLGVTTVKSPVYTNAFDNTDVATFILELHR